MTHSHALGRDCVFPKLRSQARHQCWPKIGPFPNVCLWVGWTAPKVGLWEGKALSRITVIVIDSLQSMASGQTSLVGSEDRMSYSKQRWLRASKGKEAAPSARIPQSHCEHSMHSLRPTFTHLLWPTSRYTLKRNSRWCFCHCTSVTYQNVGIILKEGDV